MTEEKPGKYLLDAVKGELIFMTQNYGRLQAELIVMNGKAKANENSPEYEEIIAEKKKREKEKKRAEKEAQK